MKAQPGDKDNTVRATPVAAAVTKKQISNVPRGDENRAALPVPVATNSKTNAHNFIQINYSEHASGRNVRPATSNQDHVAHTVLESSNNIRDRDGLLPIDVKRNVPGVVSTYPEKKVRGNNVLTSFRLLHVLVFFQVIFFLNVTGVLGWRFR